MTAEIQLQIEERIRELGDAIGLRAGVYEKLLKEDNDWAFLVQLQVIVEAAITQMVVKALNQEKAFDHVARLAFDGKTGKLQLAQSLGVLDASSADAFRALAACRNRFAHRITNIGASLDRFGESLDAATKLDLLRKMGTLQPERERAECDAGFPAFGAKLRHRLWLSTAMALGQLTDVRTHAQLVELRRELERSQQENLDTQHPTPRTLRDFYAKSDEEQ
jgi:uncharacterized protein YutE (UPF0331/DUF86 family)